MAKHRLLFRTRHQQAPFDDLRDAVAYAHVAVDTFHRLGVIEDAVLEEQHAHLRALFPVYRPLHEDALQEAKERAVAGEWLLWTPAPLGCYSPPPRSVSGLTWHGLFRALAEHVEIEGGALTPARLWMSKWLPCSLALTLEERDVLPGKRLSMETRQAFINELRGLFCELDAAHVLAEASDTLLEDPYPWTFPEELPFRYSCWDTELGLGVDR